MSHYKQYFLIPYIILSVFSLIYIFISIENDQELLPWLGPLLVFLSFVIFIIMCVSKNIIWTSEKLWPIIIFSAIGLILSLSLITKHTLPFIFSAIGFIGNLLYIFWYSANDRPKNPLFEKGNLLPDFTLKTTAGEIITSNYIKSSPALILIYRGNWCSICLNQIKEIANISNELEKKGISIYLLAAQSMGETNEIAKKYSDKPMQFLHDPNYRTLIELNLIHIGGKPKGMAWVDNDTAYPTVLYTAKGGEILWSDQSQNYRLRPEANIFLELTEDMKSKDLILARTIN